MGPPEEYSAEWNVTCALRPATIRDDSLVSPYYFGFNWFVVAFLATWYPFWIFMFWLRRRDTYIAKRRMSAPLLTFISAIFICILGPIRDNTGRAQFPCAAALWLRLIGSTIAFTPIYVKVNDFREMMLFSKAIKSVTFQRLQAVATNHMQPEVTDSRQSDNLEASVKRSQVSAPDGERGGMSSGGTSTIDEKQLQKLLRKKTYRYRFVTLILPFIPLWVFGLITHFTKSYITAGCVGCYEDLVFMVIISALAGLMIVNTMYVAYKLRGSADPLGLLNELKWAIAIAGPPGVPGLLGLTLDEYIGRPYDRGIFSWDCWLIFGITIVFHFFCVLPVVRTWQMDRARRQTSPDSRKQDHIDFRSFLKNAKGQKLFLDHLANEWSVENLKFYNQVDAFKSQYSKFKSVKEANIVAIQTFQTFLKFDAILEVNISGTLREALYLAVFKEYERDPSLIATKAIPVTVFDETQTEIFLLMERDSFNRFQRTKEFKEFITGNAVLDASKQMMVVVPSNDVA